MKNYIEEVALTGSGVHPTLTPESIVDYALSFLLYISTKTGKAFDDINIAIGNDSRLSGKLLKKSCFNSLSPYGVTCYDCNISSILEIRAIFNGSIVNNSNIDAAILISSSIGDSHINGMKFFDKDGDIDDNSLDEILTLKNSKELVNLLGEPKYKDNYIMRFGMKVYNTYEIALREEFSLFLANKIRASLDSSNNNQKPLEDMRIFIDASNGSGGFIANSILASLGADVSCSINLSPDGNFFNHLPNPSDSSIKSQTSVKTISSGSILGLVFDSDISSFGAFDKYGFEVHSPNEDTPFDTWLIEYLKKIKS